MSAQLSQSPGCHVIPGRARDDSPLVLGTVPAWVTVLQLLAAGLVAGFCALQWVWWRGEVRISQPIPNDLVANPANHTEACGYIVHELMKIVRQHPLQSAELMLRQFQDASPAP